MSTMPGDSYHLSYLMVTYVCVSDRPASPLEGDSDETLKPEPEIQLTMVM